ncbi:hypothetical protein V7S43_016617 [Phytophthora oleae]|uniref:Secreted protein n=1 Tax=Phytophthora oleae TaxID=2107226 RepID=A0ABD3EVD6_9STRA
MECAYCAIPLLFISASAQGLQQRHTTLTYKLSTDFVIGGGEAQRIPSAARFHREEASPALQCFHLLSPIRTSGKLRKYKYRTVLLRFGSGLQKLGKSVYTARTHDLRPGSVIEREHLQCGAC